MKNVQKEFKKLKNKYNLPSLKELEIEFGYYPSERSSFLQDIIESITENILDISKILESIIFLDSGSSPSQLYQAKMLNTKNKRSGTFNLFKELMSLYWSGKKIKIDANEKEMVKYIKNVYKKWLKDLKPKIVKILDVFGNEWKNAELGETQSGSMYVG